MIFERDRRGYAVCWMSGNGYRQTKSTSLNGVSFPPKCGNQAAENWADLWKPTLDDCYLLWSGRLMSARVMTAC